MDFFEKLVAALKAKYPELKDADLSGLEDEADIKAAFDEAKSEAIDGAVSSLQAKNNQLISEKRKLQEKIKNGGGEDTEHYETEISKLNEQITQLTGQVTSKDREINKLSTKLKTDVEKIGGELKIERDRNTKSLLDAALAESISKLDLTDKNLLPLVKAHFSQTFQVVEEAGERKVVAKYLDENKKEVQLTAADYADYWAKTPEGMAAVKAKASGGAGENNRGAGGAQNGRANKQQQQKQSATEENAFAELEFKE